MLNRNENGLMKNKYLLQETESLFRSLLKELRRNQSLKNN